MLQLSHTWRATSRAEALPLALADGASAAGCRAWYDSIQGNSRTDAAFKPVDCGDNLDIGRISREEVFKYRDFIAAVGGGFPVLYVRANPQHKKAGECEAGLTGVSVVLREWILCGLLSRPRHLDGYASLLGRPHSGSTDQFRVAEAKARPT